MSLKEFEFIGEITDKQADELLQAIRESDEKYLIIECHLPFIYLPDGIHGFQEILKILIDEENISGITSVLLMETPNDSTERVIKVKISDEKLTTNISFV